VLTVSPWNLGFDRGHQMSTTRRNRVVIPTRWWSPAGSPCSLARPSREPSPRTIYVRALGLISASRVGTLALAEPLTATVLGILLLAERPSLHAAIGGLLVFAALAFLTIVRVPRVAPTP